MMLPDELVELLLIVKYNMVEIGLANGIFVKELIGHADFCERNPGMPITICRLSRNHVLDRVPSNAFPLDCRSFALDQFSAGA
jgi:hypothetical protein